MWTRTLIAALYVLVGGAVLLMGLVGFWGYRQAPDYGRPNGAPVGTRMDLGDPSSAGPEGARFLHGRVQLARLQQRLNELEASLRQASTMLDKRTSELQKKNEECRSLQADLDSTLTMVFDLLAQESALREATAVEVDPSIVEPESQVELERMRHELERSEFLAAEQAQQLEELRSELMRAEAEIADIQMAAEQEIDTLLATQQNDESIASQALIETGQSAVPVLVRLLGSENSETRAFAAYILGEIGPDADAATTSLLSLLSDPNEAVRDMARQALSKIAPMSTP
jgi:HEAT repeat protein